MVTYLAKCYLSLDSLAQTLSLYTDVHGIHSGGSESLQGGGLLHKCE